MHTTRFEDYVIVTALARLSYEFKDADSELSRVAWDLAVVIAAERRDTPSEVIVQV